MKLLIIRLILRILTIVLWRTETVFFINGKGSIYKPKITVYRSITKDSYIINLNKY